MREVNFVGGVNGFVGVYKVGEALREGREEQRHVGLWGQNDRRRVCFEVSNK